MAGTKTTWDPEARAPGQGAEVVACCLWLVPVWMVGVWMWSLCSKGNPTHAPQQRRVGVRLATGGGFFFSSVHVQQTKWDAFSLLAKWDERQGVLKDAGHVHASVLLSLPD